VLNLQNETLDERRGLTPRRHGSGMTDGKNASRGVPPPPQTAGADARAGKSPTKAKGAGSTATGTDADGAPKRRHENWGARSVECYEKLEQVGEGTYGQVYMARCKETNDIVALKKIRMDNEKEGFPITAIREIKILKKLRHRNVIDLKEIVTSKASASNGHKGSIYLVFEYMDHDLTGLAERPGMKFTLPQIKCYMQQLLRGLHYCHRNNILHRDVKGSNLLINNNGILKLADFGLARSYTNENAHPLTNRVITLWYRPPELLLGTTAYGPSIDMWSAGCIFAELLYGKPILPGKNEFEQLELIFRLCGTPTPENWPEAEKLPMAKAFKQKEKYPRRVREVFSRFSPSAKELVERFLTLDPAKRITAVEALDSDWFWENPLACDPSDLPRYEPSHEFQTKKRRQEAKKLAAEQQSKRQRTAENPERPRPPPETKREPGWDRNRQPPGPPSMAGRYGGPSTATAGWSGGHKKPTYSQQGRGYGSVGGGLNSLGSRGGSYSNLNAKHGGSGSYAGYRGGGQAAGWASGGGNRSGGQGAPPVSRGGWTGGSKKEDGTK